MNMEFKHNPPTLEEIRQKRKPVHHATRDAHPTLSGLEQFAVFITHHVGSMSFFFILFVWTVGWLIWNVFAPEGLRFDPAPAFVIWLFSSNVLQLVLLPLIMVGQNLEGRAADRRAEADFYINEKAEHEIETALAHLENQNELLLQILRKIERS